MFKLNKNDFNTWQDWIKKIQNIFYLSFSIPLVSFSIAFLRYGENPDPIHKIYDSDILNTGVIIFIIILTMWLYYLTMKKIKGFVELPLREKLFLYQKEVSKMLFVFNLLMLLITILYIVSLNQIFALFFAIGLVLLSLEMPHPFKVGRRLKIPRNQLDKLMKGDEIDTI